MTDFNAHLTIASFGLAGLLMTTLMVEVPPQELMGIALAFICYAAVALVHSYIKEKSK